VKRSLCMLMAVIMLAVAMVFVPATGLAAADVKVSVTPSATELESAGEVTLDIKITNAGSEITDAVLKVNGSAAATVGTVAAGANASQSVKFNVSDSELGKDIPVTVEYICEGSAGTAAASFKVSKKSEAGNVSIKSTSAVDKKVVPYETDVNFTFVITNTGNVKLEKCVLKAKTLKGGKQITDTFSLEPGAKKTVTYTGNIIKSIVVEPTLSYVAGGKAGTHKLDKLEITMSNATLDVQLTASSIESDGVAPTVFTLAVKNSGDSTIKNISAIGYNGDSIPLTMTTLKAGESTSGTQEVVITGNAEVVVNVTGTTDTDETVSFASNTIAVTYVPAPEETPEPTPSLSPADYLLLTAETDTPSLEKKGMAVIKIKLINSSELTYGPLTLTEKTLGEIDTIDSLPPGEINTEIEVEVEESTSYVFTVTGKDANGNDVTVTAAPLLIKLPAKNNSLGGLIWVIIAIVVLIIATAVVLIILLIKDKKNKEMGEEEIEEAPEKDRRERQRRPEPQRAPQRRMNTADLTIETGAPVEAAAPTVVRKSAVAAAAAPAVRGKKAKVKELVDRNCF